MAVYELVGIRKTDFTGSQGENVSGYNLYFTYEDDKIDGLGVNRVFVSQRLYSQLTYLPDLGKRCQILYNRYGKVADIVPA